MDTMRQRILVVDDDPSLAEMLTIVLRGEGFDTAVIGDGTQALTAVRELRPDLVLLDLRLGGESGFEVARQLQAAWPSAGSSHDGLRIILISTHSESDFGRLIEASPALGFISKSSLSARAVRELLERGGRASGP